MHLKDVTFSWINLFKWLGLVLLEVLFADRGTFLTAIKENVVNSASTCTWESGKKHLEKALIQQWLILNLVVSNIFFLHKWQCHKRRTGYYEVYAVIIHVLFCPHVLKRQNLIHLLQAPGNSMLAESHPILCCLGHFMTWQYPLFMPGSRLTDTQKRVAILTFYNTNPTASGEGIS